MNTLHLALGAPAVALLLLRFIPVFNPFKRMLGTPMCVLFGLFVASYILRASPLAPVVDDYVATRFPTMAAVGDKLSLQSAAQAFAYVQGQQSALSDYKDDLASSGITKPDAHAKFAQREQEMANTNGVFSAIPPK